VEDHSGRTNSLSPWHPDLSTGPQGRKS
jgi:hypothetical protein